MLKVNVNGKPWTDFDSAREIVRFMANKTGESPAEESAGDSPIVHLTYIPSLCRALLSPADEMRWPFWFTPSQRGDR
jgi:hypothetical protein